MVFLVFISFIYALALFLLLTLGSFYSFSSSCGTTALGYLRSFFLIRAFIATALLPVLLL